MTDEGIQNITAWTDYSLPSSEIPIEIRSFVARLPVALEIADGQRLSAFIRKADNGEMIVFYKKPDFLLPYNRTAKMPGLYTSLAFKSIDDVSDDELNSRLDAALLTILIHLTDNPPDNRHVWTSMKWVYGKEIPRQ